MTDREVLGVLTGQVPVRSMPVAGKYFKCGVDDCPIWSEHTHDGVDV